MKLEQKRCSGFQSRKFFTARAPEIDFVRSEALKKFKPGVVGYTNIKAHISALAAGCLFAFIIPDVPNTTTNRSLSQSASIDYSHLHLEHVAL
jgi:hypothetical protein